MPVVMGIQQGAGTGMLGKQNLERHKIEDNIKID